MAATADLLTAALGLQTTLSAACVAAGLPRLAAADEAPVEVTDRLKTPHLEVTTAGGRQWERRSAEVGDVALTVTFRLRVDGPERTALAYEDALRLVVGEAKVTLQGAVLALYDWRLAGGRCVADPERRNSPRGAWLIEVTVGARIEW